MAYKIIDTYQLSCVIFQKQLTFDTPALNYKRVPVREFVENDIPSFVAFCSIRS